MLLVNQEGSSWAHKLIWIIVSDLIKTKKNKVLADDFHRQSCCIAVSSKSESIG